MVLGIFWSVGTVWVGRIGHGAPVGPRLVRESVITELLRSTRNDTSRGHFVIQASDSSH